MNKNFNRVIIEESLEKKDVLKKVKILKTKVEEVIPKHNTPYLKQWTLRIVEIPGNQVDEIANNLSHSLDSKHGDWYADFKNNKFHYIIFCNKIFKIDRSKPEQYKKVVEYGLSLGIPDYQLNFTPDIKE